MAIDFPNSPAVNDTYSVGDKQWKWTGTAWDAVASVVPARYYTGTTAPINPVVGDAWYNTESGKTYVWYDSFWVDTTSNILNVNYASATLDGLVSTGTQTFAGDKTFTGNTVMAGLPYKMAAGSVSINATQAPQFSYYWGNATITLPVGRFSVAPKLSLATVYNNSSNNAPVMTWSTNPSSTSFTIWCWSAVSATWDAHWQAIQMTSSTAAG